MNININKLHAILDTILLHSHIEGLGLKYSKQTCQLLSINNDQKNSLMFP